MRITGLHVERFGIWSNLHMRDMPDGMTVFYGPNEAGKSTLMQFVRTMLYGFHPERCQRFVTSRRQHGTLIEPRGRLGGSLAVADRDGEFQVRRFADESDPLGTPGDVQLTSGEGERFGAQRLATLLGGIDDTIYLNVFAVGLVEMQAISALQDTEAARQLYSLSTGADRVSLVDIMRQLKSTKARIVGSSNRSSLLEELTQKRQHLLSDLEKQRSEADRWSRLVSEREGLEEEVQRLQILAEHSQRAADLADASLRLHPKWEEARGLAAQIEKMGTVTPIRSRVVRSLSELEEECQACEKQLDTLEQKGQRLDTQIRDTQIDSRVSRQTARIAVALEQKASLEQLEARLKDLQGKQDEVELEIEAEQERLGFTAQNGASEDVPRLDPHSLSELQEPAFALEREREKLEIAKRESDSYQTDAQRISRELASALGRKPDFFDHPDNGSIHDALAQTSGFASGLRRRSELSRELTDIQRRRQEAELRQADLLSKQLMPWELVRALGVLFTLGAVLFASGLFGASFGWSEKWRSLLMLGGAVAAGLAAILKLSLDHPARDEIRLEAERSAKLGTRIEELEKEIEELGGSVPGLSPGVSADPRTELVRLEALIPLEEQRRQTTALAEQAARRAVDLSKSLTTAQGRWEKALRAKGLPTTFTPQQVSALTGQSGNLRRWYEQLAAIQDEQSRLRAEKSTWHDRIQHLLNELGIDAKPSQPLESLDLLQKTREQQTEKDRAKVVLRKERDKLRRQQQEVQRSLTGLQRKRDTLIASTGAVDWDDLEQMRNRERKFKKRKQTHDKLITEIEKALSQEPLAKQVRRELKRNSESDLAGKRKRTQKELQEITHRLQQLQYRQGELDQQIRQLADDRGASETLLEMGVIEFQIKNCIRRWQVVNTISGMLRTVYKKYEKERQPATLKEASQFLERMTLGRYVRIWTPLSEDILLVDDREGRSAPIQFLSRGTREQMFLSLRLALIADYARRGIKMPVVLDDVLVNFDADRTAAAASVLVDFARSGYQTLVFTCHQHIRDLFQQLQVDVRELPRHDGKRQEKKSETDDSVKSELDEGSAHAVLGYADPSEDPSSEYVSDWWSYSADAGSDSVRLGYAQAASETTHEAPHEETDAKSETLTQLPFDF